MESRLYERGREIIQNANELYIDLDVEADGIAGYGSLLSVGAVTPWGDTFYRELRPTSDTFLEGHRAFNEAHGLTRERLLIEGIEPAVAMEELAAWTERQREAHGKRGAAVLCAYNASFDFPLIDLEMARAGIDNPFGHAGFCIKSLAQTLTENYSWKRTGKSSLPEEIIPEGDFTHHALEDAQYQQLIHFAMAGLIERRQG